MSAMEEPDTTEFTPLIPPEATPFKISMTIEYGVVLKELFPQPSIFHRPFYMTYQDFSGVS